MPGWVCVSGCAWVSEAQRLARSVHTNQGQWPLRLSLCASLPVNVNVSISISLCHCECKLKFKLTFEIKVKIKSNV